MNTNPISSPLPDLCIVDIDDVIPHETGDEQRSLPLMRRLEHAEIFTNPPVVAAIDRGKYVLMDGANRHFALKQLGFDHILVQVANYDSPFIQLGVWQHIVADWNANDCLQNLEAIEGTSIRDGWDSNAVAQVLLRDGPVYGVHADVDDVFERNAALRDVVNAYHDNATLYRTPLTDPTQIWSWYPSGIALVMFPACGPEHIIEAAIKGAFFPPGVSRHIIHGRALNVNYPMQRLRDCEPIEQKNEALKLWLQQRLAERSVRYYAEATYQFDE